MQGGELFWLKGRRTPRFTYLPYMGSLLGQTNEIGLS
jgi:hypothetical protein